MPPTSATPTGKDNESGVKIQTMKRRGCSSQYTVHTYDVWVNAVKHRVIDRGFVLVKVTGLLG